MIYDIDVKKLYSAGYTLPELLTLIMVKEGISQQNEMPVLEDNGLIEYTVVGFPVITNDGLDRLNTLLASCKLNKKPVKPKNKDEDFMELAIRVRELFPTGLKEGLNQTWKGSISQIKQRLKTFKQMYPDYTDDQIVEATKKYVETYQGNTQYMRTLKYFIFKNVREFDEEGNIRIRTISDLAEYIDNLEDTTVSPQFQFNELK